MVTAGRLILATLAAVQLLATPWADFNSRHVFHAGWPPHARFHCAAYALLNMGLAALCLFLLYSGGQRDVLIAAGLLAWSGILLFVAAVFPGVSAVADGEKVIRGMPISQWSTIAYLALDLLAVILVSLT